MERQLTPFEKMLQEASKEDPEELEQELGYMVDVLDAEIDKINMIIDEDISRKEKERKACIWFAGVMKVILAIKDEFENKRIGLD